MSRREHLWIHEEFDIEELSEGLMLVQGMSKRGAEAGENSEKKEDGNSRCSFRSD